MNVLKKIVEILLFPFKLLFIILIKMYKLLISPLLPHTCSYTPTCSTYAITALRDFGFFKGSILAFKRIIKCTPKSKGGFDPVPNNIKGDLKWLL